MKYRHYLLVLILIFFASCNDSFLDRNPKTEIDGDSFFQTEIDGDSFFQTENDLRMYCYGLMNTPGFNYVRDAGTDNQATTDNVEVKNIMTSANPTSVTISGGWSWDRLYDINFFLKYADKAKVSEDVLSHYLGIARYYRASFYMDKVKRFSDVPWYDDILGPGNSELYNARDSRELVIEKIFEDYAYAAEHVKAGQKKGEIDKWIVLATQARAALYEGTYRKYHEELKLESTSKDFFKVAAQASRAIMDEGGFEIYNTGNPETDYSVLFNSLDLTTNPEIIQAQYYEFSKIKNGFWANMFGNYIPCPTKDLVQSYLMRDGSYYTDQPDYERNEFVDEFKDRDPRIYQTLAYPGWELINTMTYAPGAGIYIQGLNKNFTGYHQIKGFINDKDEKYNQSVDYPVIRYAEVLLIYAEAKAELGALSQTDLDQSINLLRDRAGMPHLQLNPLPDLTLAKKHPNIPPILLEIRRERRIELALEGHRYDDLMRWKAGKLLEEVPTGIYFPSLGKFDLTGDGIHDIILIPPSMDIPSEEDKIVNELGKKLIYYKAGLISDPNATVYLENGDSGKIITAKTMGVFKEPTYYYRPVPKSETDLNPNLLPQIFGWE